MISFASTRLLTDNNQCIAILMTWSEGLDIWKRLELNRLVQLLAKLHGHSILLSLCSQLLVHLLLVKHPFAITIIFTSIIIFVSRVQSHNFIAPTEQLSASLKPTHIAQVFILSCTHISKHSCHLLLSLFLVLNQIRSSLWTIHLMYVKFTFYSLAFTNILNRNMNSKKTYC